MTEETTVTTEGDQQVAPETGSTEESNSTAASQTAPEAEVSTEAEVQQFYDPKEVPPELQGSFKRMQGSYTKAMQEANSHKEKVAAYDQFMVDPIASIQQLAAQNGYQITRAEAAQVQQQQDQEFSPSTWDEVISKTKEETRAEIMRELQPYLGEMQQVKKTQIETMLDDSFPEWRAHEQEMTAMLGQHPSLANDPEMLVRLAIPKEVMESQATQKALDILKKKADASQIGAGSTTTKTATTKPDKPLSFTEAVAFAKEKLAKDGKAA